MGVAEFPFMQLGFEYDLYPKMLTRIKVRLPDRFSYTTCKVLSIIAKMHTIDITVNSLGYMSMRTCNLRGDL